jgi:hypothetical protein
MRFLAFPAALLIASASLAKPWNGIEPGASHREDVVKKFGAPTKIVNVEGKEILAYVGPQAIKGTTETQFRIDATNKLVERIDVFPGPMVDKDAVESTYGPQCASGPMPAGPCYVKKLTDDFQTYFLYAKLGLAVFWNEDGKSVHSFVFQIQKAPPR